MAVWNSGASGHTPLRADTREAGKPPRAMPVHNIIYYLPVEVGGLGLRSMEDEADIGRIVGFMEAVHGGY